MIKFLNRVTLKWSKQGGCLSSNHSSVYLIKLIEILRKSNVGCRYGSQYMGAFCYSWYPRYLQIYNKW